VPAAEGRNQISGFQDKITSFLQDSKDLGFPSEADGLKKYCKDVHLKDIEAGVGEAGTRRAFWIDDRKSNHLAGCGKPRFSNGWKTATEALRYLERRVWPARTPPSLDKVHWLNLYVPEIQPWGRARCGTASYVSFWRVIFMLICSNCLEGASLT
jgi:hypothetical protein